MISSDLADWLRSLRLDLGGPESLFQSVQASLAQAPVDVVVTATAMVVALLAYTRPGAAALIMLGVIVLGFAGLSL